VVPRDRPIPTDVGLTITREMCLAGGQVLAESGFLEDDRLGAELCASLVRDILCAALDRSPELREKRQAARHGMPEIEIGESAATIRS
jgi:hypothetical protein